MKEDNLIITSGSIDMQSMLNADLLRDLEIIIRRIVEQDEEL